MQDESKLKEHGEGFQSREKIARTPPEEEARRGYAQYGNSSLGQYQYDGNGSMAGSQAYGQDVYSAVGSGKKAASYKLAKAGIDLAAQDPKALSSVQELPLHQQYIY